MKAFEPSLITRGVVAGIGFMPIAAVALALGGWLPLSTALAFLVLPAWLALAATACARPELGRTLGLALLAGLIATLVYDAARLAMTFGAGMSDGIPNIGRMLVGDMSAPTADVFGLAYMYRYVGDGGGLALAFVMGRRYGAVPGMAFGAFVCMCLWATLAIFPHAQPLLFPLTPYALLMTMTGHLIYGGVLGSLLAAWLQPAPAPAPTLTITVREAAVPPAPVDVELPAIAR